MRENKCLRILYLAKLSFLSEREIKIFSDKKWVGFTTAKLALNNLFQPEEK